MAEEDSKNTSKIGKLILLSGPSGSGKTTLFFGDVNTNILGVRHYLPKLHFLPSTTSRPQRPNEKDGVDYHFQTNKKFEENIANKFFLEFAEYGGYYYGTSKSEVEEILKKGIDVFLIKTVDGVKQILEAEFLGMPRPRILTIFVMPPDIETLRKRLEKRSDVQNTIHKRLEAAKVEIEEGKALYEYVVFNEDGAIEKAISEVVGIISKTL
jgi:guanylate kinase